MNITSKGQVTIPLEIRQKLGLLPNTKVDFVVKGNVVFIKKVEQSSERGKQLVKLMRGKGNVRMTTDEIMALTRKN